LNTVVGVGNNKNGALDWDRTPGLAGERAGYGSYFGSVATKVGDVEWLERSKIEKADVRNRKVTTNCRRLKIKQRTRVLQRWLAWCCPVVI
jgi:hypothetical protein